MKGCQSAALQKVPGETYSAGGGDLSPLDQWIRLIPEQFFHTELWIISRWWSCSPVELFCISLNVVKLATSRLLVLKTLKKKSEYSWWSHGGHHTTICFIQVLQGWRSVSGLFQECVPTVWRTASRTRVWSCCVFVHRLRVHYKHPSRSFGHSDHWETQDWKHPWWEPTTTLRSIN